MSAREDLESALGKGLSDMSRGWARIAALIEAHRGEVLREVASMLEEELIKDPCGEAEEHVNDCYRRDITRLRNMAAEAERGEQR